ncbi:DnaD domain-containing protein [Jeotgalibacillus soli]|uniref:DNA replication protein dnaD n=1 Tax=Jeotgalibacillus soli TaxID=889306 RepID=A0A0C2RQZ0_9BACL|nr:DnaD domain-containing protein [Jeotgalibacillus soli]KIL44169.1 DNA replication protein dnaD [Jeotgalibacillus soli]
MNQQLSWTTWLAEGHVSVPVILLKHYPSFNLNEEECMLLLHLHTFIEKGNAFPTPEELSNRMTITATKCFSIIQKLITRGFLTIEETSVDGVRQENYSLFPLWKTIMDKLETDQRQTKLEDTLQSQTDLYTIFEQEFGRPLSPLECETLAMWIDQDHQSTELIKSALREAVISNKLNFRYIDRILFEWKKQRITTVDQARKQGEKFRQTTATSKPEQMQETAKTKKVPFYNWLEQ